MSTGLRTIQSNARSYTNRWRREAKISQKARSIEAGGPPVHHPGSGLGPVTNMGLISPVDDEFGGSFLGGSDEMGTPASDSMTPTQTPRPNNPGLMPPPYLPGGGPPVTSPAQPGMGFPAYMNGRPPDTGAGRAHPSNMMSPMNQGPGPIGPTWQNQGMPGGYMGHQDRSGW